MRHLQMYMIILVVYPLVVFAKRRRVSFMNCPSTKSENASVTIQPARSEIECSIICLNDPKCLSASFCETSDGFTCSLSRSYMNGSCSGLVASTCTQTAVVYPCENGGTFILETRTCSCVEGFTGDYCQRRYRGCSDTPRLSKVYSLQPLNSDYIFEWHCGQTNTNLTSVVSYRYTLNGNFTRTWEKMKWGLPLYRGTHFYFLGLENLHQLTKHGSYNLLILAIVVGVNKGLLLYKNFRVDSEAEGYACHWDYFQPDTRVTHSDQYLDGLGGAGDVTKNLNGARFATYDNDISGCASSKGSGWWYNPIGCTSLLFEPDGLHWPVNRTGTIELEKLDYVQVLIDRAYWYVDDDLVL